LFLIWPLAGPTVQVGSSPYLSYFFAAFSATCVP
jgi:hypothetical protein